jgi:hypothetical protein
MSEIYTVLYYPTDEDYKILKRIGLARPREEYPVVPATGFKSYQEAQEYINGQWYPSQGQSRESYRIVRGHIPELSILGHTAQERRQQREAERRSRSSDKSHGCVISLIVILIFAAAITAGILIYNKTKPRVPKALIPQITHVTTYRKGSLVYIRVLYTNPHHYATGFGFVGINGAGWAEENHSFADPSYGIPGPDRIDYPFNLGCGTPSHSQSDVQVWITDVAGDRSRPVNVHLTCKHWTRVS